MKNTYEDEQDGLCQPSLLLNPHLWREILLNARPGFGCEPFRDGCRRTYWLEVSDAEAGVTLTLHRRGGRIARAALRWAGPDEAVLEDLLVSAPSQRRGLATHLLDRVVALAGRYGARCLTGRVIRKDVERNPALLDWYRRCGFEVRPARPAPSAGPASIAARQSQSRFETVVTIRLDLTCRSSTS